MLFNFTVRAQSGCECYCLHEKYKFHYSQNELIQSFDFNSLEKLASKSKPDSLGAIDRNRNGYFHVRFQMGMLHLSDYAIKARSTNALKMLLKSISYSFSYQNQDGDFQLCSRRIF